MSWRHRAKLLTIAFCTAGAQNAASEVTARDTDHFVSSHVLEIAGTPVDVYRALTEGVAGWWDPAHSYSQDAANFSMDARPGGCFCESVGNGGGVAHMQVAIVRPPEFLRLVGGLGPLQGMAAAGSMDFELQAMDAGAGTRLRYRYVVNGTGVGELADAVDAVQKGQIDRLKRFVETGSPAAP